LKVVSKKLVAIFLLFEFLAIFLPGFTISNFSLREIVEWFRGSSGFTAWKGFILIGQDLYRFGFVPIEAF